MSLFYFRRWMTDHLQKGESRSRHRSHRTEYNFVVKSALWQMCVHRVTQRVMSGSIDAFMVRWWMDRRNRITDAWGREEMKERSIEWGGKSGSHQSLSEAQLEKVEIQPWLPVHSPHPSRPLRRKERPAGSSERGTDKLWARGRPSLRRREQGNKWRKKQENKSRLYKP